MPTIDQYEPETRIFALHIGRSGDGKDAAAASYPRPFHQWDFDGRFDGIYGAVKPLGWLERDNITFERFYAKNGFEPFQESLDKLDMIRIAGQNFPYKTINLASLGNFMQALINSSHKLQSGRMIGRLRMTGPGDYNFEVTGMKQLIDYLAILPCNIICSAHIIDKYGKPKTGKPGEEYAANEIIGEKLAMRDQPGEVILGYFSNVFRFSREVDHKNKMHYYVEFASDVAKNIFNIPPGRHDITKVAFFPYLQKIIKEIKEGTFKDPNESKGFSLGG